jgi:hypothetical protein
MSYFLITPFKNVKAQMELNRLGSYHHIVIRQDILCMPNWMNKIPRQPSQDPAEAAEEDQESHASSRSRRNEPSK